MFRATGARTHIWNNAIKSALLMALFPVFVAMVVYAGLVFHAAFSGHSVERGLADAWARLPGTLPWVAAGVAAWFSFAFFANVWLIGRATGAKTVTRTQEPELYNLLENLCISKGMPMPRLQIMETDALNAYAAGLTRGQYTVTVTRGLLRSLDRNELEGVLAHELAHIRHGDVRLMVVAAVFVGVIALAAEMALRNGDVIMRSALASGSRTRKGNDRGGGALLLLLLAGLAILLLARLLSFATQMAISRAREYMADMEAVQMTRNPDAMVSALLKISGKSDIADVPDDVRGMFFDNGRSFMGGLFSTHPPIPKRVEALRRHANARVPESSGNGPWSQRAA